MTKMAKWRTERFSTFTNLAIAYAVLAIIVLPCFIGFAADATFLSRDDFVKAAANLPGTKQQLSFERLTYGPNSSREWGGTLTVSNITFSGSFLVTSFYPAENLPPFLHNFDSAKPLAMTFEFPVIAFGADYAGGLQKSPSSEPTLSLDGNRLFNFIVPVSSPMSFFGFILDQPTSTLTFNDGGQFDSHDYFPFHEEQIADIYMVMLVPEPQPAILIGLVVLLVIARTLLVAKRA